MLLRDKLKVHVIEIYHIFKLLDFLIYILISESGEHLFSNNYSSVFPLAVPCFLELSRQSDSVRNQRVGTTTAGNDDVTGADYLLKRRQGSRARKRESRARRSRMSTSLLEQNCHVIVHYHHHHNHRITRGFCTIQVEAVNTYEVNLRNVGGSHFQRRPLALQQPNRVTYLGLVPCGTS